MISIHSASNIAQRLSKELGSADNGLLEIDLNALKSLIEENSKRLDQYINDLRD